MFRLFVHLLLVRGTSFCQHFYLLVVRIDRLQKKRMNVLWCEEGEVIMLEFYFVVWLITRLEYS